VRETEAHSLVQQIGGRVYRPRASVNGIVKRIRDPPDRDFGGSFSYQPIAVACMPPGARLETVRATCPSV
jgi:hypothetical protein